MASLFKKGSPWRSRLEQAVTRHDPELHMSATAPEFYLTSHGLVLIHLSDINVAADEEVAVPFDTVLDILDPRGPIEPSRKHD